jgi:hypothetical protein
MTRIAADIRAKARDEVLSQVAADHVRHVAENLWLADRLAEYMSTDCPASLDVWQCPHDTVVLDTDSGLQMHECWMSASGDVLLRDCWLAAARAATNNEEG